MDSAAPTVTDVLLRCADPAAGVYCHEVTARQAAAVDAIAVGCWDHAEQLAATAARIADVHRQELKLRGRA